MILLPITSLKLIVHVYYVSEFRSRLTTNTLYPFYTDRPEIRNAFWGKRLLCVVRITGNL